MKPATRPDYRPLIPYADLYARLAEKWGAVLEAADKAEDATVEEVIEALRRQDRALVIAASAWLTYVVNQSANTSALDDTEKALMKAVRDALAEGPDTIDVERPVVPVGAYVASALAAANIPCDSGEDVDRFLDELAKRGYRVAPVKEGTPR